MASRSAWRKKTLAEDLLQREVIVKKLVVHAGCSFEVAQHRDALLYEHMRSGRYEPKPHQFKCPKCLGTAVVVASAEVTMSIVEKMAAVELQLKETLGADVKLLPADVGPHRAVRLGREQPWRALTSPQVEWKDGAMGDLPDRIEWGN
ncbi:hypothetical protein CYMTET_23964 [Cymbomonas tetramitiformis]|uniref:Uncharacterized protein n=1 Tax=Cymbomonas tetramitiformis TaxID=36881 RepID=A0AAE0L0K4_9CHLO|nr:hypothetical protein CYMTET_23964 [Cymbomonas tetramitiformis]